MIELEGLESAPPKGFWQGVGDGFVDYFADLGSYLMSKEAYVVTPSDLSGIGSSVIDSETRALGIGSNLAQGNNYEAGYETGQMGGEITTILATEGAVKSVKSMKKPVLEKPTSTTISGKVYTYFKDFVVVSTDEINAKFKKNKWEAPYKTGTKTYEFTLTEKQKFVRVTSSSGNIEGDWLVRKSEIDGLTPAQIQDKLALPSTPTRITDVEVGAGSKLRKGTAAPAFDSKGGGTQYQLLNKSNVKYGKTTDL